MNGSERDDRQQDISAWIARTYGQASAMSLRDRAARVMREAIELANALELDRSYVGSMVEHVYAMPPGLYTQKIGSLEVSILALCETAGISADAMEKQETVRVMSGLAPEAAGID